MAEMPARDRNRAAARFHQANDSTANTSPSKAATVPGPQTAPGVSNSPGGRIIGRPFGPTKVEAASAVRLNESDSWDGMKRAGSYTCRTPTTELMPLQTRRSTRMRTSCRGRVTNAWTQKTEQNTDA